MKGESKGEEQCMIKFTLHMLRRAHKTERLSGLAIVKSFVKYKVLGECKIQKVKGRVFTFV